MPVPAVAFAALAQFLMVVLFNISNATRFVLNFCCVAFENWLQVGIRSVFGRKRLAGGCRFSRLCWLSAFLRVATSLG